MGDSLVTIRAAVRDRADLSNVDPMFDDDNLNRQINMAYRRLQRAQPDGWWFQHAEVTRQNGASAAHLFNVVFAPADDTRMIRKVYGVFVSLDGSYYQPIPLRERTDQVRLTGGRVAEGFPSSWQALPAVGYAGSTRRQLQIVFEPHLPAGAWVKYLVVADGGDLTADADTADGLPAAMTDAIVEQTVSALTRQRKRVGGARARASELAVTQAAAEDWVRAARLYWATPYAGTGYPTLISGRQ